MKSFSLLCTLILTVFTLTSKLSYAKEIKTNVKIGPYLKYTEGAGKGYPKDVNYYQARDYCCMENGLTGKECENLTHEETFTLPIRLPTAREAAIESTKNGAIVFEEEPNSESHDVFYIKASNADGQEDRFWYDMTKYSGPEYYESKWHPDYYRFVPFWTSSTEERHGGNLYIYKFGGEFDGIKLGLTANTLLVGRSPSSNGRFQAVRCAYTLNK